VRDGIGRNTDFAADVLQLRERHSVCRLARRRLRWQHLARAFEDRGDFVFAEAAFGHSR
jgi:hypothetical protein